MYGVAEEHVRLPLANFSMTLPPDWGMPLGWSLTLIPILLTVAGLLYHLFGKKLTGSLGIPFKMVGKFFITKGINIIIFIVFVFVMRI
mgnify:CR=1 FL=1